MQCLKLYGLQCVPPRPSFTGSRPVRNASLTSAISRGIRKGADTVNRLGTARRNSEKNAEKSIPPKIRSSASPRSRLDIERSERLPRPPKKRWGKEQEIRTNISQEAPLGVPYTTAGSEFLYGTFAVKAALEAKRRRLHKLFVWKGERSTGDGHDESIFKLARSKRVQVQEVAGTWDKMLMKMSGQRPHNGYVLEASPIPKLPVTTLDRMESIVSSLTVTISPQSSEDQAVNNIFRPEGSTAMIPRTRGIDRYPLLLWLDRITDTGNLGAIIRTAYFFGVDAILIPEHGTAPFGPITVKASAGTAEYLPVLTVRKELDFVRSSKEKGWRFFAAVAPESASTEYRPKKTQPTSIANALDNSPCVLMVGNEGEGLRSFMQKAADEPISIESARDTFGVVDSLNVSVAAALLIARFLSPHGSANPVAASDHLKEPESLSKDKSEDVF